MRPVADWQIATVWDEDAETLHGNFTCRAFCARIRVRDFANAMNRELT